MTRIEEFLKLYKSKKTSRTYRWVLEVFFKFVYGQNENKLAEHGERYFTEKRDYEKDISNFLASINDKPPKSVRLMLAAVKSFLMENDVELPQKFWHRLIGRVNGNRALIIDKVPSNVELRRILTYAPVQGKALFLMLASGGMRIGETLKIGLGDLELDREPAKVNIRGSYTKTGNSRIAFISKEAKEAVEQWLKVRQEYLVAAVRKSRPREHYKREFKGKSEVDERVFPFEVTTAYVIWSNALRKCGLLKKDSQTNRHTIHPHVLRKFFRSKMAQLIPVDIVEALMGHEGYLTEVYRRYSEEDLAKFYLEGESSVLIFTEAGEVTKLRAEVEDRNKSLQVVINGLTVRNMEMEEKIKSLSNENKLLEEKVKTVSTKAEEVSRLKKELSTVSVILRNLRPIIENIDELAPVLQEILAKRREEQRVKDEIESQQKEDEENAEILKKLRSEGKTSIDRSAKLGYQ